MRRFLAGDYFRTAVLTLDRPQVDRIIDALRVERPEFAVDFFHLLKDWYQFRHSRVSSFVVSHLLAGKRRFKELQLIIKQLIEEEVSGAGIQVFWYGTCWGLLIQDVGWLKMLFLFLPR